MEGENEIQEKLDQYAEKIDKILAEHPEVKAAFDLAESIMIKGMPDEDEVEVELVEIDGIDYMIVKEFNIRGNTYFHLSNISDPMDQMYRKQKIEDGEEYLVPLDSEHEFDMVMVYEQKYFWRDLKRKQEFNAQSGDEPSSDGGKKT